MLHVVRGPRGVLDRLRLDEALFRDPLKRTWLVLDDESLPREGICVVLGISGKIDQLVFESEARSDRVELIRRFTGGGTVAIDRNAMLVSIVSNASKLLGSSGRVKPFPREILRWSADEIFAPAFAKAKKPNSTGLGLAFRENDYVINHTGKVGGNAQAISGDRFCHHTSFLWRVNPKAMSYLKHPERAPDYREGRCHESFLDGLETSLISQRAFSDAVLSQLKRDLKADQVVFNSSLPPLVEPSRNVLV